MNGNILCNYHRRKRFVPRVCEQSAQVQILDVGERERGTKWDASFFQSNMGAEAHFTTDYFARENN